ncbi:hypothetical protein A0H81_01225 [Grifola frondosa]|uniref:Uncharacterized protein n=1 Tax=Grifola frondosa TaxID=5627 RepID=A0A1C7MRP7_GRIFR|nr:hypothetical protein A0H81_01225 [Grifola frondosa]
MQTINSAGRIRNYHIRHLQESINPPFSILATVRGCTKRTWRCTDARAGILPVQGDSLRLDPLASWPFL